ncbi:hypothetical protein ACCC92_11305 [Mucilaginibacter sp. Mucisp84]|uniref:5-methylcytosine restriction system specificity protein McrC n=1 Tax=Mucilaginibacter sp. Mucisp84 TaxID=3243058 RepID=UPI0039A52411
MKAQHFFRREIKDNNYRGKPLSLVDDFTQDFIGDNWYRHNKPGLVKHDVTAFILQLGDRFSGKTLRDLGIKPFLFDEEFDANLDQPIFTLLGSKFESAKIFTGNIAGSIVYKGQAFNINCRFGDAFLAYMIASTSGFLSMENLGAMDKQPGMAEWIFIYYWKLQLKKAFSLGVYKSYDTKSGSLLNIRGSIDVNAWLKKATFDGKTTCTYKEHSYNNLANVAIWMALDKVYKSKYTSLVKDIFAIKTAYDSIGLNKVSPQGLARFKIGNPFYKKYEQVVKLSLMYLENKYASVGNPENDFDAFLFDISLLFEHHCRKVLQQKFTLFRKNKEEYTIPNGIGYNNLFPDIIIDHGDKKISIFDVKYKHFNGYREDKGIERADRFQIATYVSMYMAGYEIVECGVVYPLHAGSLQPLDSQTLEIAGVKTPFRVVFYEVAANIANQPALDNIFKQSFKSSKSIITIESV